MKEEFFKYLPSEIIINILSRLPIRTIIICKVVRKSWLNLLNSPEFIKTHLSESKPVLVVHLFGVATQLFKLFEFDDSLYLENHELHYNPVEANPTAYNFILPCSGCVKLVGSVNGLIFLWAVGVRHGLYIYNPITRDYIRLPRSEGNAPRYPSPDITHGFGVSKISGQYKVVRIFYARLLGIRSFNCQVYTLGTGSWRTIASGETLIHCYCGPRGVFVNGNLHWLVKDLKGCYRVSCFDLQTELFSSFLLPRDPPETSFETDFGFNFGLVSLGDSLCLWDNSSEDELVIWLMQESGYEKYWSKEFVIRKVGSFSEAAWDIYPMKVFRDGDILLAFNEGDLCYYSYKTKLFSILDMCDLPCLGYKGILHSPSFLSLKSFPMEDAKSL